MPSPPISRPASLDIAARIQAQEARIAELEAALWQAGLNESALADYQAAYRELEGLLGTRPEDDRRHHFLIVIPVADSPEQLHACLDSLLTLCRAYGYGGRHEGRFRKVSVLLADDSADSDCMERNREIARTFARAGIRTEYFGIDEQLALGQRLHALDLTAIVGMHPKNAFGHKGQAMMRNIAYLKLAEMRSRMPGERFLFYTIDADQQFMVKVATPQGARSLYAVNYLYHLDRIFDRTDARILTGKVVGDPPVSPAVMAANFLDDVISFVHEMAACDPKQPYRQPIADPSGSGEAAYHDMAEMFGFKVGAEAYRYRCKLDGLPGNETCFVEFSERLNHFFHGEHPTRITWYRYQKVDDSLQPARTVYTGNYVFSMDALEWFIPFAPLRLRMSGPTMGRLLKSAIGDRFVSANIPMLHRRTLEETGRSEFRPGVVSEQQTVVLCDEFERQFFGDVMLFSIERLTVQGLPAQQWPQRLVAATLDTVYSEMQRKYRSRQQLILDRLDQLRTLLRGDERWWNRSALYTRALARFEDFVDNLERNFGAGSTCRARIDSEANWAAWRERQLAAIIGLHADQQTWQQALAILSRSGQE